jgi:LysR family transcriptional regulator, low CO2-responsive transcriptional regulator
VAMTLTQLKAFIAVARLGSVKAAAESLEVTEPAVSGAVAALRRELGDPLFVRGAGGIALTAGGRRLAVGAAEIVGLAEETRQRVREAGEGTSYLRVASTESGAELVVPALLEAFTRRQPDVDTATIAVPPAVFPEILLDRRADVAIGPAAAGDSPTDPVESIAFLRYQLVVVASPSHPLGARATVPTGRLPRERWLLGPDGLDPGTPSGAFLTRYGVEDASVSIFPSATGALDAVAAGEGLSVAFLHLVRDELRRGMFTAVDVPGTPVNGMFYANALRGERRSQTASALCRFVTTPAATQALLARSVGVPVSHFRPTVHVTLWS